MFGLSFFGFCAFYCLSFKTAFEFVWSRVCEWSFSSALEMLA